MEGRYFILLTSWIIILPLVRDEGCVPVAALLDDALLGWEVDVDEAEARTIALRPLEVVQQGPGEVAFNRNTLGDRLFDVLYMLAQVVSSFQIMHDVLAVPGVGEGRAVLRND